LSRGRLVVEIDVYVKEEAKVHALMEGLKLWEVVERELKRYNKKRGTK